MNKLETLINKNQLTILSLSEQTQNFMKLLDNRATLIYKDCKLLHINFDSKINSLIFKKCSDIVIKINGVISGIEIEQSTNITIIAKNNSPINNISINKSNDIIIKSSKTQYDKTNITIDNSNKILLCDDDDKKLAYY